jgi:hypothetical protein
MPLSFHSILSNPANSYPEYLRYLVLWRYDNEIKIVSVSLINNLLINKRPIILSIINFYDENTIGF